MPLLLTVLAFSLCRTGLIMAIFFTEIILISTITPALDCSFSKTMALSLF